MWLFIFFFFNDTATTEIYTLSLHDALPISIPDYSGAWMSSLKVLRCSDTRQGHGPMRRRDFIALIRSEEHTSELQSQSNLVCRLLLEKKKKHTLMPISPFPSLTSTHSSCTR